MWHSAPTHTNAPRGIFVTAARVRETLSEALPRGGRLFPTRVWTDVALCDGRPVAWPDATVSPRNGESDVHGIPLVHLFPVVHVLLKLRSKHMNSMPASGGPSCFVTNRYKFISCCSLFARSKLRKKTAVAHTCWSLNHVARLCLGRSQRWIRGQQNSVHPDRFCMGSQRRASA